MTSSSPHGSHPQKGSKRHAQLRDEPPRLRPLWVYDPEDWAEMQVKPLVCPEPGCRTPFQKPIENNNGTRFLKDMPHQGCSHVFARPERGGGPISKQHWWMQARLMRICESLGYGAIPEHYPTYADVYVPKTKLAIEYERWSRAFEARTRARHEAGADRILWLVPEDANNPGTNRALFSLPVVRVKIRAYREREPLRPWENADVSRIALLYFYATVAKLDPATNTLVTRAQDAKAFLREVLEGRRRWHPPGTPRLPSKRSGAWVLTEDLDKVNGQPR